MDLSTKKYNMEASTLYSSHMGSSLESKNALKNPFLDTYADPLCKLKLKESSDFVKSLPVGGNNHVESKGVIEFSTAQRVSSVTKRSVEAPPTPGRPVFSFSHGSLSRKSFPSKWDDAEKWLVSGSSCHDSPGNNFLLKPFEPSKTYTRQCSGYKTQVAGGGDVFNEEIVNFPDHRHNSSSANKTINDDASLSTSSVGLLLKDKFPNEPLQDQNNSMLKQHRDIGTEMTPLGSSTTSRFPTPFKSSSPARHNTPANRSGPLDHPISTDSSSNTVELQECHLAELTGLFGSNTNWSSREEEEEDVSKSLRHFEMSSEFGKSVSESRVLSCAWEEEEKAKTCLRYQREQAKIQAWVKLQSAKAEAESRKLEVKIQKMRSNFEEKMMKRMAEVRRKAEELRAEAMCNHSEQVRKVDHRSHHKNAMNRRNMSGFWRYNNSCGCFPCNNKNHHI